MKTRLKNEQTTSKKTLCKMEIALTESTALSQRSEHEYLTLLKDVGGWKSDTALKEEMPKRDVR